MAENKDAEQVRAEIEALGPWFHNLHLEDGSSTAPHHPYGDFPRFKWRELEALIPRDLTGWTALDIGCNAGFYSFELARRGATVTGIDCDEHYLRQARWAADHLGLAGRVGFEQGQVYDLARDSRRFDLILFMGLYYHLRYAVLALDTVARLRPRLLVFQTLSMPSQGGTNGASTNVKDFGYDEIHLVTRPEWPKIAFVEHSFGNDPTNWWLPDRAACRALLRSAGFRIVANANGETFVCEPSGEPPCCEEEWRAATGVGAAQPQRGGPR